MKTNKKQALILASTNGQAVDTNTIKRYRRQDSQNKTKKQLHENQGKENQMALLLQIQCCSRTCKFYLFSLNKLTAQADTFKNCKANHFDLKNVTF